MRRSVSSSKRASRPDLELVIARLSYQVKGDAQLGGRSVCDKNSHQKGL